MKNFTKYLILVAALLLSTASAQTILTPTTLSVALSDSSGQVMTVASVSTVSGYTVVAGTDAYIDSELVTIKPLNGTVSGTTLAIIRGQGGTTAAPHASGALVFLGPPSAFASKTILDPQGSCTRTNELYLPSINVRTGIIADCLGGAWVQGVRTTAPKWRLYSPEPGAVAYTSINTDGTLTANTIVYCTEVLVPTSKLFTGIGILAGATAGHDRWYVILYDKGGNRLANSAVAGATTGSASVYQEMAFTSRFYAVGPAQYFSCFQSNGTTDNARMAVTGVNDNVLTKGQTGATFGTIPALTVPTGFATAVGPYVYLY